MNAYAIAAKTIKVSAILVFGTMIVVLLFALKRGTDEAHGVDEKERQTVVLDPSELTGNTESDRLRTLPPEEQMLELGRRVGNGCIGKLAFYDGLNKQDGAGYWSVACMDSRSFLLAINSDGTGKMLDCGLVDQLNFGRCFQKFKWAQ